MRAWSYSYLKQYESCPHKIRLKEERVKVPKKSITPELQKGLDTHKNIELYLKGKSSIPTELNFPLEKFKELKQNKAIPEYRQAFDLQWKEVQWTNDNAWARMILDAWYLEHPGKAKIIDFKTGGVHQISYDDEGKTFALGISKAYPMTTTITVEYWYTDLNHVTQKVYKPREPSFAKIEHNLTGRALKMSWDNELYPKPSKHKCAYCAYESICEYADVDRIQILEDLANEKLPSNS